MLCICEIVNSTCLSCLKLPSPTMLSIRTTHCGSLFPRGRAAQVRSEARQVERADLGLAWRHASGGPTLDAELGGGTTHLSWSARLNSAYPYITATAREDHVAGGGTRQEARWRHGWSSTRLSVVASSMAVHAKLGAALRGSCGGRRHTTASSVAARVELSTTLRAARGGELGGGTGVARGGASGALRREAAHDSKQAQWRRGWSSA
jgi:hypothetical protein